MLRAVLCVLVALVGWGSFGQVVPYQGRLVENGQAFDGVVDVRGRLFDAPGGGNEVSDTAEVVGVVVTEGLFSLEFAFPDGSFDGVGERWLEVSVDAGGGYEVLSPRQRVLPAAEAGVARFALDAANALQADVALEALSGPFEPADTTRRSASGLPLGAVFLVDVDAGEGFERAALVGGIELERGVVLTGGTPSLGQPLASPVVVRRGLLLGRATSWWNAFDRGLLVRVEVVASGAFGATTWSFDGLVSGYTLRLADDGGLIEEAEILPDPSSFDRDFVQVGQGVGPTLPVLAGGGVVGSLAAGTARLTVDGSAPSLSLASVLPELSRDLNIGGGGGGQVLAEPVSLVRGVWTPSDLYSRFVSAPVVTIGLEFESSGGGVSVVEPPLAGSVGALSVYRVELADDGLPVEVYEVTYEP